MNPILPFLFQDVIDSRANQRQRRVGRLLTERVPASIDTPRTTTPSTDPSLPHVGTRTGGTGTSGARRPWEQDLRSLPCRTTARRGTAAQDGRMREEWIPARGTWGEKLLMKLQFIQQLLEAAPHKTCASCRGPMRMRDDRPGRDTGRSGFNNRGQPMGMNEQVSF